MYKLAWLSVSVILPRLVMDVFAGFLNEIIDNDHHWDFVYSSIHQSTGEISVERCGNTVFECPYCDNFTKYKIHSLTVYPDHVENWLITSQIMFIKNNKNKII